ncbi:hypothetical protein [Paraburkholderia acidicola]|nr:hypothetical protein [Paraburkholderia acidicola]
MKRIEQPISKKFKHCWMYRDDLERVIEILTVNGVPPVMQCDEFEFESAAELYNHLGKKGKRALVLRSIKPHVRISTAIFSGAVDITTYDQTNDARALFSRVVEAVEAGERKPHWRERLFIYVIGIVLMSYGGAYALLLHDSRRYIAASAFVAGIPLFVAHVTYRRVEGTRFFGIARAERQSFFQRKGDDLAVGLISGITGAVIGGVLGVLGTLLLQK